MSSRRTVMMIAAAALAVVAFVSVLLYVGSVRNDAYEGAKRVPVYVVKTDVPKGTLGDTVIKSHVTLSDIPQEFLPTGAITNKDDLDSIRNKVTVVDLQTNQYLVQGSFIDEDVASSSSARLKKEEVAVSVSLDSVKAVGGNLQPGDRVNIMTLLEDQNNENAPKRMAVLYQNVRILFIGTRSSAPTTQSPEEGEAAAQPAGDTGVITFAVPPVAASRIALAANEQSIWLTLVSADYDPIDIPTVLEGGPAGGTTGAFPSTRTPYPDEG